MGKRKLKALGVVLGLATLLCGCQIGDTQFVFQKNTANRKEVFTLNGEACSLTEAKLYLSNYRNIYGNAYGVELWNYDFGEASLEDYIKEVTIDELTRIACMEQIAKEQEVELTEDEKKKIKEIIKLMTSTANGKKWQRSITSLCLRKRFLTLGQARKILKTTIKTMPLLKNFMIL